MIAPAIAVGWIIGWAIAAAVIVIAAALLIVIIALGGRITKQAEAITAALDGARANTDAMYAVTRTNLAIDRITRGLRAVRTGEGS